MKTTATKMWKTAIYVRISKEDGDKIESDSIVNQKDLIIEFLKNKSDIQICSVRMDDGFTGVNFERPSFTAMMADIKAGLIDCVAVKDLSRFGRNWIEAGKYLQQIFPFMGVRFISINDNFDSQTQAQNGIIDSIALPLKNLINDFYCRDISAKTKSHLEIKCKKGDFIGAFAVYGYKKDSNNHNQLIVDENVEGVIKEIFNLKISGMSCQGIANRLNTLGILAPMAYKKSNGLLFSTGFVIKHSLWSSVAVKRILTNEVFTGVLEQGKKTTVNHKVKQRIHRSKDEWFRVDDAHTAIISRKQYETVQELLKQDIRISPDTETEYMFSGILKCGDCKQNMIRKTIPSAVKSYVYYVCSANKFDKSCSSHSIRESILTEAVLQALRCHIASILSTEKTLAFIEKLPLKKLDVQRIDKQIQLKESEVTKFLNRKSKLYEDLTDGIIDRDEYNRLKETYTSQAERAEKSLIKLKTELDDILNNRSNNSVWIEHFKEYSNISELSRSIVVSAIDKIYVYEDCKLDIAFKYQYDFEKALHFIETVDRIDPIMEKGAI